MANAIIGIIITIAFCLGIFGIGFYVGKIFGLIKLKKQFNEFVDEQQKEYERLYNNLEEKINAK